MTDISPDLFVDTVQAFQKTAAIKAAVELDLFTLIGAGARTTDALAARTGASGRGLRILCDYLTTLGFLEKSGGAYSLTLATAQFINRDSAADMSSIVNFLAAPELFRMFLDDPVSYVRQGGTAGLANMAPNNPIWGVFARAMVPFAAVAAAGVASQVGAWAPRPRYILDIAAGSGMYGITLAKAMPEAEVTALDWEHVLEVARENAARAGVSHRYRTLAGSAFETEWGAGYDLILLTNFLHHFDRQTNVGLLRKARGCLSPAGRVVAVEFVPNEDRISPPLAARFAFVMLATTQHGDAFTGADFAAMARDAGYGDVSVTPLAPSPESMVTFHT